MFQAFHQSLLIARQNKVKFKCKRYAVHPVEYPGLTFRVFCRLPLPTVPPSRPLLPPSKMELSVAQSKLNMQPGKSVSAKSLLADHNEGGNPRLSQAQ